MAVKVESWGKRFNHLVPMVKRTALKLARVLSIKRARIEVFLVGNQFMKKNVMSFPAPRGFPNPNRRTKPLGEIFLNPDHIAKEGEELSYMLIHGVLHLLGYGHKKKNDIIRMEKKERQLLKLLTQ